MKQLSTKLLLVVFAFLAFSCSTAKKASKSKKTNASAMAKPPAKKPGKNDPKPYNKVITKDAKSGKGLFTVHKVKENYYYEIPDSLFEREDSFTE